MAKAHGFLLLFLAALAGAHERKLPQYVRDYMAQQFPLDNALNCPVHRWNGQEYCMRYQQHKSAIDRNYVLLLGDNRSQELDSQGVAQLLVFDKAGKFIVRGEISGGSHGHAPVVWKWLEIGQGLWAAQGESTASYDGIIYEKRLLLYSDGAEIHGDEIRSRYDNSGQFDQCDGDCERELTNLRADLRVRHDLPASNGLYRLEMLVDGHRGIKQYATRYERQPFRLEYDLGQKRYLIPDDYPLEVIARRQQRWPRLRAHFL